MRIVARKHLVAFASKHPNASGSLEHWEDVVKAADWASMDEVVKTFSKARRIDGERARFEIGRGDYRLIIAFDFGRRVAFLKFLGTHAEYDRADATTVSDF